MTISKRNFMTGAAVAGLMLPSACISIKEQLLFNVLDFGAVNNSSKDSTAAFQSAIDSCAKYGGGIVTVPPGQYVSGGLFLRSNVTLYLNAGAILKASANRADFHATDALLFAEGERNIAVAGPGLLDGHQIAYMRVDENGVIRGGPTGLGGPHDPEPREASKLEGRPRIIFLVDCQRVRLDNVEIQNAATWTVHLLACRDVEIEKVTINNDLNVPNNDGFDIDHCKSVRISNCNIRTGDDALCFKSTNRAPEYGGCEDIVVTNCNLTSRSSAIKLGSAGSQPIRNLIVSNCTISDSNRGVAIQNRDGAIWENIMFSQMTIETRHFTPDRWGASEPIYITNLQRLSDQERSGLVRNVMVKDLICTSEAGAYLRGDPFGSVESVTMSNISIQIVPPRGDRYGVEDLRPSYRFRRPSPLPIAGINAFGVSGLLLDQVDVSFAPGLKDGYSAALYLDNCENVDHRSFKGTSQTPGQIPNIVITEP